MKTLARKLHRLWRWLRGRKRLSHPQLWSGSNVQLRTVLGEDFRCRLDVYLWKGRPRPQARRLPIYNLTVHLN